jgi:hypothetical protein
MSEFKPRNMKAAPIEPPGPYDRIVRETFGARTDGEQP